MSIVDLKYLNSKQNCWFIMTIRIKIYASGESDSAKCTLQNSGLETKMGGFTQCTYLAHGTYIRW